MRRVLMAAAALSVLTACSQDRDEAASQQSTASPASERAAPAGDQAAGSAARPPAIAPAPPMAAPTTADSAAAPRAGAAEGAMQADGGTAEATDAPDAPELAYDYRYQLEAPEQRVAGLMRRHERACVLAGSQVCQLLGAETSVDDDSGKTQGELRLRAVPVWIEDFRDGLETDIEEIDGRIVSAATGTDDLTRQLGDSQAHVLRLTNERDRLQRELRAFRGPIAGRLEIERELEAVTAELNSGARDLRSEEARVTMASMTVSYRAREGAVARGDFAPVARAAQGFTGTVMAALGGLMTIVSVLLVPGLVVAAIWGGIVLLRRRRRPAAPPPTTPTV